MIDQDFAEVWDEVWAVDEQGISETEGRRRIRGAVFDSIELAERDIAEELRGHHLRLKKLEDDLSKLRSELRSASFVIGLGLVLLAGFRWHWW